MVQTPLAPETACTIDPAAAGAAPESCPATGASSGRRGFDSSHDARCTTLMESFRRHRDPASFDALARLAQPVLLARARVRVRTTGSHIDPEEAVQDALVNVYRYPHHFRADRPGAFAAWSTTILDNVIRRHLRRNHLGRGVQLHEDEFLTRQADERAPGPDREAEDAEERERLGAAWCLFLALYHRAWLNLGERERHVLGLVELHGMRYAEIASLTGSRPEALKMVVFRARKRIHDHLSHQLGVAGAGHDMAGAQAPAA